MTVLQIHWPATPGATTTWPAALKPASGAGALRLADLAEGRNRGIGEALDVGQVQPARQVTARARAQTEVMASPVGHG